MSDEQLDQINVYYEIELNISIPDIDSIIQPTLISSFTIEKDFNSSVLPQTHISFNVERKYMNLLKENQKTCIFNVTLTEYQYLNIGENVDDDTRPVSGESEEFISKEEIFSEDYTPFYDNGSFNKEQYDPNELEVDNVSEDDAPVAQSKIDLIPETLGALLINNDNQSFSKILINGIATGAKREDGIDIGTVLHYICDMHPNGYILDKPSATVKHKEIKLFTRTTIDTFLSLQYEYGIYTYGLRLFLDNDCLYVLNKYQFMHDFEDGENNYSELTVTGGDDTGPIPLIINEDDNIIKYIVGDIAEISEVGSALGEQFGDSVITSNYNAGLKALEFTDGKVSKWTKPAIQIPRLNKSSKNTGEKVNVDYDEFNNPFNIMGMAREASEERVFTFAINNSMYKSFKPNKGFKVIYLDEVLNATRGGNYLQLSNNLVFINKGYFVGANTQKFILGGVVNLIRDRS